MILPHYMLLYLHMDTSHHGILDNFLHLLDCSYLMHQKNSMEYMKCRF